MHFCHLCLSLCSMRNVFRTQLLAPQSCTCVLRILRSADDLFWPSSCSMVCWIPINNRNIHSVKGWKLLFKIAAKKINLNNYSAVSWGAWWVLCFNSVQERKDDEAHKKKKLMHEKRAEVWNLNNNLLNRLWDAALYSSEYLTFEQGQSEHHQKQNLSTIIKFQTYPALCFWAKLLRVGQGEDWIYGCPRETARGRGGESLSITLWLICNFTPNVWWSDQCQDILVRRKQTGHRLCPAPANEWIRSVLNYRKTLMGFLYDIITT